MRATRPLALSRLWQQAFAALESHGKRTVMAAVYPPPVVASPPRAALRCRSCAAAHARPRCRPWSCLPCAYFATCERYRSLSGNVRATASSATIASYQRQNLSKVRRYGEVRPAVVLQDVQPVRNAYGNRLSQVNLATPVRPRTAHSDPTRRRRRRTHSNHPGSARSPPSFPHPPSAQNPVVARAHRPIHLVRGAPAPRGDERVRVHQRWGSDPPRTFANSSTNCTQTADSVTTRPPSSTNVGTSGPPRAPGDSCSGTRSPRGRPRPNPRRPSACARAFQTSVSVLRDASGGMGS